VNLDAVGRLEKKVVASDGSRLRAQLAAVARTYRVFLGNDRELQRYLAAHRELEAALRLWDTRNRDSFERFLDEVDRLLHNYLASVAALRDHTRRLWQKYPPADEALRSAYTARVTTTFAASPGCAFIQDLRNFSLHRRLALARGRLSFSPQAGLDAAVILVRQDLESWDGWKAPAREYLNAAPDEIDLAEVVSSYSSAVVEFNDWFGQAFVGGHLAAFDDLAHLEGELAAAYQSAVS
jgi:hypothetical protein